MASPPDLETLKRCLQLAARARGRTLPNPMVGAVVSSRGRIISEAWHARAGGAHAERAALLKAGSRARGATLYANLEPCCHYGRTPPCTDAILDAGISRVVVCHRDPDPRVSGKGIAALRRAGIRVDVGLLRKDATHLNEVYLTVRSLKRPFIFVKAAMSIDGRIATRTGDSRWISSPRSRRIAHDLRSTADAVVIGAGTAMSDDPRLTARRGRTTVSRQPMRVVIDPTLSLKPGAGMLKKGPGGPVLVYTSNRASSAKRRGLERAGATVIQFPAKGGHLDLRRIAKDLMGRGVNALMLEGGGELIASALEHRLVDKMVLFISPRILGGRDAVPLVGGRGVGSISKAIGLYRVTVEPVGDDIMLQAYVKGAR